MGNLKRKLVENLLERMPRNGLSRKCQDKYLNFVVNAYVNGKSEYLVNEALNYHRRNGFVRVIYNRIEYAIKKDSLKIIAGVLGRHHEDLMCDVLFADSVLDFCVKAGLEKKLMRYLNYNQDNELKDFLKRKYKEKIRFPDDRKILKQIAKKQEFYLFILKEILYKKDNQK